MVMMMDGGEGRLGGLLLWRARCRGHVTRWRLGCDAGLVLFSLPFVCRLRSL